MLWYVWVVPAICVSREQVQTKGSTNRDTCANCADLIKFQSIMNSVIALEI